MTTILSAHKKGMITSDMQKQAGLALPLTLILLFAMTLIAIATLRTTTMEENMTANSRLRQIAFNAAETALVEATDVVKGLRGQSRRALFFGSGTDNIIAPDPLIANKGDVCTNGFCTPAKYNSPASPAANGERWEDTTLNVWGDANKHITFSNYAASNLDDEGVFEAPKYIIEFLGNFDLREPNTALASNRNARPKFGGSFTGNCRDPITNALQPPNDKWPYCASDPAVYRITVRATAGPAARQAVVLLQATVRLPHS